MQFRKCLLYLIMILNYLLVNIDKFPELDYRFVKMNHVILLRLIVGREEGRRRGSRKRGVFQVTFL